MMKKRVALFAAAICISAAVLAGCGGSSSSGSTNAMRYWALQYGPYVEVLKPESLRKQIREDVENMVKKYKD